MDNEHLERDRDRPALDRPLPLEPSALPVASLRTELIHAIQTHQQLVVVGETGSGKTTQLPQYILQSDPDVRIVVTQPRRIAAITNARRVAHEMDCAIGDRVGYTIRFESVTSSSTRIKYVTDGVLLRELIQDDSLPQYSVVIIDEAHERTVGTDILLGLLKKCVARRSDLKLIIMSATLDAERFSDYYHECPIFQIPGRPFPVEIMYARDTTLAQLQTRYVDQAIETALHIHKNERPGDILVFLCGSHEIERACVEMMALDRTLDYERDVKHYFAAPGTHVGRVTGVQVVGVHASMETIDQRSVFNPAKPGLRKIVFATNIAQTSITIPGIVFVVDCGFVKQKSFDPTTRMDALLVMPISRSAATQRAGRAGRTQAGKAYRLYAHKVFAEDFSEDTTPEIQRTSLLDTVLALKELGIADVLGFDFLDRPDPSLVMTALRSLYLIGALDESGRVTPVGHRIAQMPIAPYVGRAVIAAADDFACLPDMLILASMLSVEHIWIEPRGRNASDSEALEQAAERRRSLAHPTGDHLTLINVFRTWAKQADQRTWCRAHSVNQRALLQGTACFHSLHLIFLHSNLHLVYTAKNIHSQLSAHVSRWKTTKHPAQQQQERIDPVPILKSLCTGFFSHLAKKQQYRPSFYQYSTNVTVNTPHDSGSGFMSLFLHSMSSLCDALGIIHGKRGELEWVIYNDVTFTSRANMRYVSRMWDWSWVQPYLPRLQDATRLELSGATSMAEATPETSKSEAADQEQGQQQAQEKDTLAQERAAKIEAARLRALQRRQAQK
ncbi:P-loop containing nucleoside triphosphate hydrolase protein [Blastocladiella britannica]|nr:P-loop containing nucleoside triphosphate hydrolase protein [Blastocladiella britannica]